MAVNYRLISCSPQNVFDVLANGWLYPAWVVGAARIRAVNATWPAKDTQIFHSVGSWPLLIDDSTSMLEWDPPHKAVLRARAWPLGEGNVIIEVKPRGTGCAVRMTEDIDTGPGMLVPKLLRELLIKVRNKETMDRLAYMSEGRTKDKES